VVMRRNHLVTLALALAICLATPFGAFALNQFTGTQANKATFETLEETRVSGPVAVASLETNAGKTFKSHPVLDGYPQGTTYVYRSPNMYGGRASARLNTDILVFTDKSFAGKEAALAYLKDLGLTSIADQAIGAIVLVTPADPKAGFGAADQKNYYALQTAMLAQKASVRVGTAATYFSDAEYFGGFAYTYVIGIDGGATFLNNYVAGTFDFVSRIAGMLLINGKMDSIRDVAALVPAYLVNPSDSIAEKYKKANAADSYEKDGVLETYYNQARPLQRVSVAKDAKPDIARYIKDAYYGMFIRAMRVPVVKQGLFSASTPYQNYNFDEAPYSLCKRDAVIDDQTADGIRVVRHTEDRFKEIKTDEGEYLQTWFEYLPKEVVDGTAAKGTVPLILANHGSGDDPRVLVDELGLLDLAGRERLALVAPEHQYIGGEPRTIEMKALPALVEYMLKTYPALDASRVYAMGYSMGGGATLKATYGKPSLFAAAAPMSPVPGIGSPYAPADADLATAFKGVDIPMFFTTSGFDLPATFDQASQGITPAYQTIIKRFVGVNELKPIDTFDFATYPHNGFKADRTVVVKLNNEYQNTTWYLNNDKGVPMLALSFTEGLIHALYPEYGQIAWNFVKHYKRNLKTGAVEYDPNTR
jgi:poly(3-hydroxybutyrate) depolymerase